MAKRTKRDDFARSDGGLYLPKYGLRGPDRLRPDTRRWGRRKCCCGGKCGGCSGDIPQEVEVIISGVVNRDCFDCGSLNGTYVLDYSAFIGQEALACQWLYEFPSPICGIRFVVARGISGELWVSFASNDYTDTKNAWQNLAGPADCSSWNNEPLPYWISGLECYSAYTTAYLTAL